MASSVNIDGKGRLIRYDNNRAIREHLALAELSDVSIDSVGAGQLAAPVERAGVPVCDSARPRPLAIVTGAPLGDARPLIAGVQVRFDLLWVIVAFEGVTEPEMERFQAGEIGLYLQEMDGLISLVVSVEDVFWCDGMFTAHSGAAQALPAPKPAGEGYLVTMILVDLATRIVKAWRTLEADAPFSRGLFTLWLRDRNRLPLPNEEFRRRVRAPARHFSPQELASRPYQFRKTDAAGGSR